MRINAAIMQQDTFLLYNRAEVRFLFYELYKIGFRWNGLCLFAKNNTINLHTLWQKLYKSIFKSRFISISQLHRGKLQSALHIRAHTETFDWDMTPNRYLSPPHTWLFYPPPPTPIVSRRLTSVRTMHTCGSHQRRVIVSSSEALFQLAPSRQERSTLIHHPVTQSVQEVVNMGDLLRMTFFLVFGVGPLEWH